MSIRLKVGRSFGSDLAQIKTSKMRKPKVKTPDSISSNNVPILTSETQEIETASISLAADMEVTQVIASIIVTEVTVITLEESVRSKFLSPRSIDRQEEKLGDVARRPMTQRNRLILKSKRKVVRVELAGPTRRTQSYLSMMVKRGPKSMSIS